MSSSRSLSWGPHSRNYHHNQDRTSISFFKFRDIGTGPSDTNDIKINGKPLDTTWVTNGDDAETEIPIKCFKWGDNIISYDVKDIKRHQIKRIKKKMPILMWTVKNQEQVDNYHDYYDNIIFQDFIPQNVFKK